MKEDVRQSYEIKTRKDCKRRIKEMHINEPEPDFLNIPFLDLKKLKHKLRKKSSINRRDKAKNLIFLPFNNNESRITAGAIDVNPKRMPFSRPQSH